MALFNRYQFHYPDNRLRINIPTKYALFDGAKAISLLVANQP